MQSKIYYTTVQRQVRLRWEQNVRLPEEKEAAPKLSPRTRCSPARDPVIYRSNPASQIGQLRDPLSTHTTGYTIFYKYI